MKRFFNKWGWWLIPILIFIVAFTLTRVVIINSYIPSASMETTLMTGDSVIGSRLAYTDSEPERGDIIIFYYPDDEKQKYVKRIIGMPGETVTIENGITYIDGQELYEPYLKEEPKTQDFGPYTVPEGHYFCLGDNRNNSNDSRYWENTYVAREKIIAKAGFVYWPIDHIGTVK